MLKLIPLGGLGEIGLNMMVVEYGDRMFVIDAGLMFPEQDMLGVDYVIPDFEFLRQHRSKVLGIVLTHAHEDHIGALPYVLRDINVPVFGTPFTLGMVRHKLEEHGLLATATLHEVKAGERLKLDCFEMEFIRVSHSVVDGVGLAIDTPMGQIVHTGDFKINPQMSPDMRTDIGRFAQCGERGVLALLSDSTNVEKEGYTLSDEAIGRNLSRIARRCTGRMVVATFASSIARIQQVVDIADKLDRKVIFSGRSIETSVRIARSLGYLSIPDHIEMDLRDIDSVADDELVIVTTGSQGEPMAALARMASGNHKYISMKPGDTVVLSSKFIPGNERAITSIINQLYRQGANVVYERIADIHVSGHGHQEELKMMINLTRPKHFMPVHGEYRHLYLHAQLAQEVGIPANRVLLAENGQVVRFDKTGARVHDTIPTGRVLIDGKGIGDVGRSVLKERRSLSEDGLVVITMAFDEDTGIIIYGPEIESRGFVFETATGHLVEDAKCVVLEIVDELGPDTPNRLETLRTQVRTALKKYFSFTISRRPVILPFILEL